MCFYYASILSSSRPKKIAGNNYQAKGLADLHHLTIEKELDEADPTDAKKHEEIIDKINSEEMEVDGLASRTWVIGTVVFVSGSLLNFASYGFAAQSLLACLEAIQFVTNILFSKFLLGVDVSPKQWTGTAIITLTVLVCIWFAGKEELTTTIPDMIILFGKYGFLAYVIFMCAGVIFLYAIHIRYQAAIDRKEKLPNASAVIQVSYATGFALFGTFSVVLAKCMAQCLGLLGWPPTNTKIWGHWFLWSVVVGWLCFMSVWLYGLNSALDKYEPIFILPLLQMNFIIFAIISGGIFFEEFVSFCGPQWVGFILGVMGCFYGVSLLIPTKKEDDDTSPGTDDEAEEPTERPSVGGRRGSITSRVSVSRRTSISLPQVSSMAPLHLHGEYHKRRLSTTLRRKSQAILRKSNEDFRESESDRADLMRISNEAPEAIPESISGEVTSTDEETEPIRDVELTTA